MKIPNHPLYFYGIGISLKHLLSSPIKKVWSKKYGTVPAKLTPKGVQNDSMVEIVLNFGALSFKPDK